MGNPLVLALDCGTQSLRAMVFDSRGNLVEKEKVDYQPFNSPQKGWAEQDPDFFWQTLCSACQGLKKKAPEAWDKLVAVALTTQRDTVVMVDKEGNPLRPAILWLDQRKAKGQGRLFWWEKIFFTSIGMGKTIRRISGKAKANWLRENQPEIWASTYKYLLLSGYLTFKMTGRFVDSAANQIGYIPFGYKKQSWPKENHWYYRLFGVEKERLPELVAPGSLIGDITGEAAQAMGLPRPLPLIASASDKGCESLGAGCIRSGTANISFGTTATVQTFSRRYVEPVPFMPAYPGAVSGSYNPEIQISRGYWMIRWFKEEFSRWEVAEAQGRKIPPEVLLNQLLEAIPPGSDGLILLPFWGPSLKHPEAKGAIIGFGDGHTRGHMYRAIIEGIDYSLREGLENLERRMKSRVDTITVSGGGAQSDEICQITADLFNRPIQRGQTHETSGLGAAIHAFVGLGIYPTYEEAVQAMVHRERTFQPEVKNAEIYERLYHRVYKPAVRKFKKPNLLG